MTTINYSLNSPSKWALSVDTIMVEVGR